MKEPIRTINKNLCLTGGFINKVKSPMVLSKRSLIHSDSFQPKFIYTRSFSETDLLQGTQLFHFSDNPKLMDFIGQFPGNVFGFSGNLYTLSFFCL
jgi:hypothetical protein